MVGRTYFDALKNKKLYVVAARRCQGEEPEKIYVDRSSNISLTNKDGSSVHWSHADALAHPKLPVLVSIKNKK